MNFIKRIDSVFKIIAKTITDSKHTSLENEQAILKNRKDRRAEKAKKRKAPPAKKAAQKAAKSDPIAPPENTAPKTQPTPQKQTMTQPTATDVEQAKPAAPPTGHDRFSGQPQSQPVDPPSSPEKSEPKIRAPKLDKIQRLSTPYLLILEINPNEKISPELEKYLKERQAIAFPIRKHSSRNIKVFFLNSNPASHVAKLAATTVKLNPKFWDTDLETLDSRFEHGEIYCTPTFNKSDLDAGINIFGMIDAAWDKLEKGVVALSALQISGNIPIAYSRFLSDSPKTYKMYTGSDAVYIKCEDTEWQKFEQALRQFGPPPGFWESAGHTNSIPKDVFDNDAEDYIPPNCLIVSANGDFNIGEIDDTIRGKERQKQVTDKLRKALDQRLASILASLTTIDEDIAVEYRQNNKNPTKLIPRPGYKTLAYKALKTFLAEILPKSTSEHREIALKQLLNKLNKSISVDIEDLTNFTNNLTVFLPKKLQLESLESTKPMNDTDWDKKKKALEKESEEEKKKLLGSSEFKKAKSDFITTLFYTDDIPTEHIMKIIKSATTDSSSLEETSEIINKNFNIKKSLSRLYATKKELAARQNVDIDEVSLDKDMMIGAIMEVDSLNDLPQRLYDLGIFAEKQQAAALAISLVGGDLTLLNNVATAIGNPNQNKGVYIKGSEVKGSLVVNFSEDLTKAIVWGGRDPIVASSEDIKKVCPTIKDIEYSYAK